MTEHEEHQDGKIVDVTGYCNGGWDERSGLPKVRFHDLGHTHASVLVAHDTPIKVVTERLGHAHLGFTMQTYQHLLPGMSADAATRFAGIVATAGR